MTAIEHVVRVMVFNRRCDPDSKLGVLRWLQTVSLPEIDVGALTHQQLLRSMEHRLPRRIRAPAIDLLHGPDSLLADAPSPEGSKDGAVARTCSGAVAPHPSSSAKRQSSDALRSWHHHQTKKPVELGN